MSSKIKPTFQNLGKMRNLLQPLCQRDLKTRRTKGTTPSLPGSHPVPSIPKPARTHGQRIGFGARLSRRREHIGVVHTPPHRLSVSRVCAARRIGYRRTGARRVDRFYVITTRARTSGFGSHRLPWIPESASTRTRCHGEASSFRPKPNEGGRPVSVQDFPNPRAHSTIYRYAFART